MSIGSVASRTGVTPSAIRYYEGLGLISPPQRAGGQRRFGPDVIPRLRAIGLFKQAGFTMADLAVLLRSEPWPEPIQVHALASAKIQELERLAEQVQVMKAVLESIQRCGCLRLEDCQLLLT